MSSDPHALSEIAIVQGGYAFKSADFGDEGVAVVKIANIQPPLVSLHEKYLAGYAQHLRDALPNATFVAFTGTPVSSEDRDTRAVFGDYIHIYDMRFLDPAKNQCSRPTSGTC